jgi:hypothetical protein
VCKTAECARHTGERLLSCRQGPGLEPFLSSQGRAVAKGPESHFFCLFFSRKATLADIVEQLQEKEAGPGIPAGVVS